MAEGFKTQISGTSGVDIDKEIGGDTIPPNTVRIVSNPGVVDGAEIVLEDTAEVVVI